MNTEDLYLAVAVYNGDSYIVQSDEEANELLRDIENSTLIEVTDEDEYKEACDKLDFAYPMLPHKIYKFFVNHFYAYLVLAEDYGD